MNSGRASSKPCTSTRCRETKAAEKIVPVHELQLINYLKATGLTVGLLLNFGPRATFRRFVLSCPQEESAVTRLAPRESAVPP